MAESFKPGPMSNRPTIVCLCGSTRFFRAFEDANLRETLEGKIVLSLGSTGQSDAEIFAGWPEERVLETLQKLAELHFEKIRLADEILVLNVGGYVGQSTRAEIEFAQGLGKKVRWLE